jgi:hypothetical protein
MPYPDNFLAAHPASPYAPEADHDETPAERFVAAAQRLERLCNVLNDVWDQHADIAGGCNSDDLVGEVADTLEAALAPLRSRIDNFVSNCEINGDAVFQRGVAALNAIIQQGRAQ